MGPKKARKDVGRSRRSNVELDYDDNKFLNKNAQDEYEKMRGRPIAKERAFKPSIGDGHILRMLNERGWLTFSEEMIDVPMGIVREFYANGKIEANGFAFVRGTIVDYQPETILEVFGIPPPPEGVVDWCTRSHEDLNLDAIVARLCVPGTDWIRKEGTNEPEKFLARYMNKYARTWNLFICSNLMPSTHTHEINVQRAILLWGILNDEYIDLSYLLYSSILRYMQSGSTAQVPHAVVITRLCARAGVNWGVEEQMQRPKGAFTRRTMEKMEEWEGGVAHPRGLGYIVQDPQADAGGEQDDDEDEQGEQTVPSPRHQRAARGARVSGAGPSRVRTVMSGQQHRRLRRQVDAVNDRTARFATDMIASLDEMSRALGYAGNWPTYGQHHPYPAPDSPPEEGASDE